MRESRGGTGSPRSFTSFRRWRWRPSMGPFQSFEGCPSPGSGTEGPGSLKAARWAGAQKRGLGRINAISRTSRRLRCAISVVSARTLLPMGFHVPVGPCLFHHLHGEEGGSAPYPVTAGDDSFCIGKRPRGSSSLKQLLDPRGFSKVRNWFTYVQECAKIGLLRFFDHNLVRAARRQRIPQGQGGLILNKRYHASRFNAQSHTDDQGMILYNSYTGAMATFCAGEKGEVTTLL